MAAANDSQGLKIAVAAFVTLTVVLAVTTYFAYSSYSEASAKEIAAQAKAQESQKAAAEAIRNFDFLKDRAGYDKAEDFAGVQDQIKKADAQLNQQLSDLQANVRKMVEEYRAAGGNQEKLNELSQAADQAVSQILNEPNRTYQSTISRMTELLDNMSQLLTSLTLDNEEMRKTLASVDQNNAQQLQVQLDEVKKAKEDLAAEHMRHEEDRRNLITKNDELTTERSRQEEEIQRLNQLIASTKDETTKRDNELHAQLRSLREQVEKNQEVMDVPDGKITYVDYTRGEVQTDLTRSQGARERLQLSVFDRNSPGLPTDRPKGLIELVRVGDRGSIGRIVKTNQPSDPIKLNDHVYSAAWSPNQPQRFALIGKIDVDRDGREDRQDLIRLIRASGGEIDYDLPPPGIGKEQGKITGLTSWYVVDDRDPIRPPLGRTSDTYSDDKVFVEQRTEALRQAHLNGVRPISIDRLLAMLGYSYGSAIPGRAEAIDPEAVKALINPRGRAIETAPPTDATTPENGAAEQPEEQP
jgi:hypothetical protein